MIERGNRKTRDGRVITKGGDKTIGVMVERRIRHPLYGKEVKVSKKVMVHDEENKANIGDTVRVMETRPISKSKCWRLVEIIAEATK
jgi:small subunit ribosomal protein S17